MNSSNMNSIALDSDRLFILGLLEPINKLKFAYKTKPV